MAVPYTFGSATAAIPLSQLDSNFATTITLGNTAVQLGNTVTTLNNMTLINATVSSGNVTVTNANVTSITATSDSYISGLTVGKGAGAISTNTAVGASALAANTTGDRNFAVGGSAMAANTTGVQNAASGYFALTTQTTGNYNAAFGAYALTSNTTAANNTASGYAALYSNTTGASNVGIGFSSLFSNTTASNNTAVGYQAGYTNVTGTANVYIGQQTGFNATGIQNTFVGQSAGYYITSGAKNTILGQYTGNQGGLDIRTASNYIVLSDGDGNPRLISNGSGLWGLGCNPGAIGGDLDVIANQNGIGIGYSSSVYRRLVPQSSNVLSFISASNTATLSAAGAWTNASDARLKKNITDIKYGLNTVVATQPRSYERNDVEGQFIGFIAQELKEQIPEVVFGSEDEQYTVDYGSLVAVAFKAIQELKAEFDAYKEAHP